MSYALVGFLILWLLVILAGCLLLLPLIQFLIMLREAEKPWRPPGTRHGGGK